MTSGLARLPVALFGHRPQEDRRAAPRTTREVTASKRATRGTHDERYRSAAAIFVVQAGT
jgi:hypothetical protein